MIRILFSYRVLSSLSSLSYEALLDLFSVSSGTEIRRNWVNVAAYANQATIGTYRTNDKEDRQLNLVYGNPLTKEGRRYPDIALWFGSTY